MAAQNDPDAGGLDQAAGFRGNGIVQAGDVEQGAREHIAFVVAPAVLFVGSDVRHPDAHELESWVDGLGRRHRSLADFVCADVGVKSVHGVFRCCEDDIRFAQRECVRCSGHRLQSLTQTTGEDIT